MRSLFSVDHVASLLCISLIIKGHSQRYQIFRNMLLQARKMSGSQVQVASKLGKPQSFVSKYEQGERRIDVAEFFELADVIDIDVLAFFENYKSATTDSSK